MVDSALDQCLNGTIAQTPRGMRANMSHHGEHLLHNSTLWAASTHVYPVGETAPCLKGSRYVRLLGSLQNKNHHHIMNTGGAGYGVAYPYAVIYQCSTFIRRPLPPYPVTCALAEAHHTIIVAGLFLQVRCKLRLDTGSVYVRNAHRPLYKYSIADTLPYNATCGAYPAIPLICKDVTKPLSFSHQVFTVDIKYLLIEQGCAQTHVV